MNDISDRRVERNRPRRARKIEKCQGTSRLVRRFCLFQAFSGRERESPPVGAFLSTTTHKDPATADPCNQKPRQLQRAHGTKAESTILRALANVGKSQAMAGHAARCARPRGAEGYRKCQRFLCENSKDRDYLYRDYLAGALPVEAAATTARSYCKKLVGRGWDIDEAIPRVNPTDWPSGLL